MRFNILHRRLLSPRVRRGLPSSQGTRTERRAHSLWRLAGQPLVILSATAIAGMGATVFAKVVHFSARRSSPSDETQSSSTLSSIVRGIIPRGNSNREETMPDPSIFKDDTIIRELTSEEEQSLRKLLTEPAPVRPKSRQVPFAGVRE